MNMECSVYEDLGIQWLKLKGRIDGMTCGEVRRHMDDLVQQGKRTFAAHLEEVNYISSAGLRVFLEVQKQLIKVGGEMLLFGLSGSVLKTFDMSGFLTMFKSVTRREELVSILKSAPSAAGVETEEVLGIPFRHIRRENPPGKLKLIGSQEKLSSSGYTEADVVTLAGSDVVQGFGLATLGDQYEEYKNLFGEAVVLNRSLFFYPATKHPSADFMLCGPDPGGAEYRFLNGAGFGGDCRHILSFEGGDGGVEASLLLEAFFHFTKRNVLGIVLLAESKGFWGMNIRKSPIIENRPANGKDIFDRANFQEWMNFPVEPGEFNHVVVCVGIAVQDPAAARAEIAGLVAGKHPFHMHGAVFSKGPLSKDVTKYEKELNRVLNELEVIKVQHVLGQSRFASGMVGLYELED
jgi:anti-anti-sigma factor